MRMAAAFIIHYRSTIRKDTSTRFGARASDLKKCLLPVLGKRVPWCHLALGCWITFAQCHPGLAQSHAPVEEAAPLEPVTAVLNAFRIHRLVALDEGDHNNPAGLCVSDGSDPPSSVRRTSQRHRSSTAIAPSRSSPAARFTCVPATTKGRLPSAGTTT